MISKTIDLKDIRFGNDWFYINENLYNYDDLEEIDWDLCKRIYISMIYYDSKYFDMTRKRYVEGTLCELPLVDFILFSRYPILRVVGCPDINSWVPLNSMAYPWSYGRNSSGQKIG